MASDKVQIHLSIRISDLERVKKAFGDKGIPLPYSDGDLVLLATRMWLEQTAPATSNSFLQQ